MELQGLLEQQKNTLSLIEKAQSNFKKTPKERFTRGYLTIRSEMLQDYWNSFRTTHLELLKNSSKEQKRTFEYFVNNIYEICEDLYLSFKSDITDMLQLRFSTPSPLKYTPQAVRTNNQEIKLPKINIPQFIGNYQDWTSFYDIFDALIHKNENLSKVQKMHYLKSSLSGEAEQLLKHISVTEANYELAWNTLQKRYNNKRIIINNILSRLINQKKISNCNSARGIREILDTTVECLNKLQNLEIDTKSWGILIIYLTVTKLDSETHKEWEEEVSALDINELPTLDGLTRFLEKKFRVLEMISPSTSIKNITQLQQQKVMKTKSFHLTTNMKCSYCQEDHAIYNCKEFVRAEADKKKECIQNQRLCFNCLIPGHIVKLCKSKSLCRRCGRKHHSLLHGISTTNFSGITPNDDDPQGKQIVSHLVMGATTALMSTALVKVINTQGQAFELRALLDPCSQETFITESAAQLMKLRKQSVDGHVVGVDQMKTSIKSAAEIELSPRTETKPMMKMKVKAYIVRRITNIMPVKKIQVQNWEHLRNLHLADPTYYQPGHVDLLLGINVYNEVLLPGLVKGVPGSPMALQTHLGWVLSGKVTVGEEEINSTNIVSMHLNVELNNMLRRFWELENLEEKRNTLTPEEVKAEEIYHETTTRDEHGRFVVRLPLRNDPPVLPKDSREIALERFKATERRLHKNTNLREDYNKVLQEYVELKHLEKVKPEKGNDKHSVYLPHHAVIKEDRETTKVRLVFNASCPGTNGVSLNDELLVGPKLQAELKDILLRWRKNKIAFVSDVEKMYRQIRVCKENTDLQRILWRSDPMGPIEDYRLLTVTFGMSCAPYLAVKTLKQTAIEEGSNYPESKDTILQDFYMDDLLSGRDTEEDAIRTQKEITKILEAGGFILQKWCSNSEKFMENLKDKSSDEAITREIQMRERTKALGLTWEVKEDSLSINNSIKSKEGHITKRTVLSEIATLFDPMGWIAPVIVLGKIFIQKLWKCHLPWDETLTPEMREEWLQFKKELHSMKKLSLNRWIYTTKESLLELHGFADASASAYAAVVYARVINDNEVKTSLLTAKTKVSPIKQITLPRLELCAATLLAKLLKQVSVALRVDTPNMYAWSDSQVVLAWIHGEPMRWTTFVRNRVLQITENVESNNWFYVNTKQNPADPASRGVLPEKLLTTEIWWNGPDFLKEKELELSKGTTLETSLEKKKVKEIISYATTALEAQEKENRNKEILTLIRRYSSLNKLVRVIAYSRRWLLVLKKKENNQTYLPTYLTPDEQNSALINCIKLSQKIEFPEEIESLNDHRPLKKKSRILPLYPFLDEQGVLRVGGRLKYANIEYMRKHPVIISKDNALLPLLLADAHARTLHGGPQLMVTYLRNKYWLIDAINTVKRFVRKCVICMRQAATQRSQIMGELPKARVIPSRPFLKSGVDYAGPVSILIHRSRGAKTVKAYIALFICMSTKAIHLELVSDLTAQAFIAAFKRFVARRGRCEEIWSDQGRNFHSANKELMAMWKENGTNMPRDLVEVLAKDGTQWHFIPPYSPNFGGLWEAGVKSVKYHLKRILTSNLAYEEMLTILTQIEACLNSRPLKPLDNPDPEILDALTPGHFLVGEPLVTVPDRNYTEMNINRMSRWQLQQRIVQDFWKRWHEEYLTSLQQRSKWLNRAKEFNIGEIVLVKEENIPPSKWSLARIVEKHPGPENITRVYTIKCRGKITQRSISKLCPFPLE